MRTTLNLRELRKKLNLTQTKGNIMHIPFPATAGGLGIDNAPVMDSEAEYWYLPGLRGKCYSVRVMGRSMQATLNDGDIVICNKNKIESIEQIKSGYIYIADTNEGLVVKRVERHIDDNFVWLRSDNPGYEDTEMSFENVRALYQARRVIKYDLSFKMDLDE